MRAFVGGIKDMGARNQPTMNDVEDGERMREEDEEAVAVERAVPSVDHDRRAFVVAAVLTPPDVISQLSLAIPTILLYEASILSVKYVERRRREADAAAAASAAGEAAE